MRRALLLMVTATALGQELPAQRDRLWKISLVSLSVAAGLDAASSMGRPELHPLLRGSGGRFGWPQAGIKLGVTAGGAVIQVKNPRYRKIYTVANFVTAGFLTGMAVRNWMGR